jgi:hypothetical protein
MVAKHAIVLRTLTNLMQILEALMDRDDGQDIRHYDSTEAIAASQQLGDKTASGGRVTDPDEEGDEISLEGFPAAGAEDGVEASGAGAVGTDDSNRVDENETADIYGESSASLDFDPDTDPLGMGTDESDDMITDDR